MRFAGILLRAFARSKISLTVLNKLTFLLLAATFLAAFIIAYHYPGGLFFVQIIVLASGLHFYRNNIVVLVFLIFCAGYLYLPKHFFIDNIPISFHGSYQTPELFNLLVTLNIAFFIGFYLGLRKVSEKNIYNKKIAGRIGSSFMFYILIVVMAYSVLFGIRGETVFQSGGYGLGKVTKGTLHEYFIVFFFASVLFMDPRSQKQIKLLVFFFLAYNLKTILYGGRIEAVQLSLLTFLLLTNFFKEKRSLFFLLVAVGMAGNYIIGNLRSNPLLIFEPLNVLVFDFETPAIISSQFGDVNQSSLRVLGLVNDGKLDFEQRVLSLLLVIFGSAVPAVSMPDIYNLATYRQDLASSGGGGMISAYSYAWMSYIGPLLMGIFIGSIYRALYNSSNTFLVAYAVMVAISFPRWFAYYPVTLFKFDFLIVAILLVYYLTRKFILIASKRMVQ